MSDEYLGEGLKFPISINPATGRAATSKGNQSVKESIYIILSTAHTERLARPSFGANLSQYTFMDINGPSLNMMIRDLTETIMAQEPRVETLDITPEPDLDNGRLIINIDYWVAGAYSPESIVYPFYLNAEEEEEEKSTEDFTQVEDIEDGNI